MDTDLPQMHDPIPAIPFLPPKRSISGKCQVLLICLLVQAKSITAILLPASLSGLSAERLFLAVTDDADAAGRHACTNKNILCGIGSFLSQREVVLIRSTFITEAADQDLLIWMAQQILRILSQRSLCVTADIVFVVVEKDVMDIRYKLIFATHGAGRSHRNLRGWVYGNANRCIGRASSAVGYQMVIGGLSWSYSLHARGGYFAQTVDRDRGGLSRFPG